MINANELRIGSKVLFAPQGRRHHTIKPRICTVKELNEVRCVVEDMRLPLSLDYKTEDIQPVLLTPEILEACGFAEDHDPYINKWFNSGVGYIERCEGGFTFPDSDGEPSISYAIISLHQLQNYYLAIVGSELPLPESAKIIPEHAR